MKVTSEKGNFDFEVPDHRGMYSLTPPLPNYGERFCLRVSLARVDAATDTSYRASLTAFEVCVDALVGMAPQANGEVDSLERFAVSGFRHIQEWKPEENEWLQVCNNLIKLIASGGSGFRASTAVWKIAHLAKAIRRLADGKLVPHIVSKRHGISRHFEGGSLEMPL